MIIDCQRLFDGDQFLSARRIVTQGDQIVAVGEPSDPALSPARWPEQPSLQCRLALPGLIDCHAYALGYNERPPGRDPFLPHEHALKLFHFGGVTALRDMGNSLEALSFLSHVAQRDAGPRIFHCGPALDGLPLTHPTSRLVLSEEGARRAAAQLAAEGAHWLRVRPNLPPELLPAIVEAARQDRMKVAVSPGAISAEAALLAGADSLELLLDVFTPSGTARGSLTVERVRSFARLDLDAPFLTRLIDLLVRSRAALCPMLLSTRRRVFLQEVVNEPYLDYMVLVMPFHRHFKAMRNTLGYAIGKRYMNQYMPYPTLDKTGMAEAEAGCARMRELLRLLHARGVRLVAGTDAPNPSLVPGLGMHHELRQWALAGLPIPAILSAATAHAAELLGEPRLGRIRPGAHADLLLLSEDLTDDLGQLVTSLAAVVCRGQVLNRKQLGAELVARLEEVAEK
ncbi:MAG: amidohydrolase family protein [Polyangia bacterium]